MNTPRQEFSSEAEVAHIIELWLKGQGWTVYKEVKPKTGTTIADIVAIKDGEIWIVETKLHFGTQVLEQAYKWSKVAHKVSIGIPANNYANIVLNHFMNSHGIGQILVYAPTNDRPGYCKNHIDATKKDDPPYKAYILGSLHEKQLDSVAGVKGGGYVTPYSLTIDNVKEFLKTNGPSTMEQIVSGIKHHYTSKTSAINTLTKRLIEVETEFETKIDNGKRIFWLQSKKK